MKIILDTNVIHRDYNLNGSIVLKLSDAAKTLGYEVYVPEVVIDEVFRQYRNELGAAYEKYTKGASLLSDLGQRVIKQTIGDDYLKDTVIAKKTAYHQRLKELGISVLPYPATKHKSLVLKELEGRKPFTSSKKGYRDALIWETVKAQLIPEKDLWGDTQVLFLTENTQDFADSYHNLHPELIEEFTSIGFTDNAVELVSDFDKFFSETIDVKLGELKQIAKSLLEKRKFQRVNLDDELQTLLYDEYVVKGVLANEMEIEGVRIPMEYESPTVQDIYLKKIDKVNVHRLTDGSAIIDCELNAAAEIEFFLFKGEYPLLEEEDGLEILDWDWNEHYYLASIKANVKAKASFRVSEGFYKVISKEVHTREVSL